MFEFIFVVALSMAVAVYLVKLVQFLGMLFNKTKVIKPIQLNQDTSWKLGVIKYLKPLNK